MRKNRWENCIKEALHDAGITATAEQVDTLVIWIEGEDENGNMSSGYDAIPSPHVREIEDLKKAHANEVAQLENQIFLFKKSVAIRRGVKPSDVFIEDGDVKYDPS